MKFSEINYEITPGVVDYDFNGKIIHFKTTTSVTDKAQIVAELFSIAPVEEGVYSRAMRDVAFTIECFKYYTDIEFEDETLSEIYDFITKSGLKDALYRNMADVGVLESWVKDAYEQEARKQLSALGIVKNVVENYDATKLDAQAIIDNVKDPEVLKFVKGAMELNNLA